MKKFIFVKTDELSNVIEEIYQTKHNQDVNVIVTFDEENDTDVFEIVSSSKTSIVDFSKMIPELSNHFQESITHYDVMEVGDFGVGFLFFY